MGYIITNTKKKLISHRGSSGWSSKNEIAWNIQGHDLKVTAEINYHDVVNFLDVTLNLSEQNYQPYLKPNNDPTMIRALCMNYCQVMFHRIKNGTENTIFITFLYSLTLYLNTVSRL